MSALGFSVDHKELGELGQQLANLRGELTQADDAIGPLLGTISDAGLRHKLTDFAKNWSEKRAQIITRLDQTSGFAVAAAETYREADTSGAASFSGP
jgi:hypothetical protein